jgi:hypothetical protein
MGKILNKFEDNTLLGERALSEIELMYDYDDVLMQTKFDDYDYCSSLGNFNVKHAGKITWIFNPLVNNDPCVTAGDIFKCGMTKDKVLTQNTVTKYAIEQGEVRNFVTQSETIAMM